VNDEKSVRADVSSSAKAFLSNVKQVAIKAFDGRISVVLVTEDRPVYACAFDPEDIQRVVNYAQRSVNALNVLRNAKNDMVAAIQAVRVLTDCDIKTAKDIVETLLNQ
jgi:ribosomal protein L7/L12